MIVDKVLVSLVVRVEVGEVFEPGAKFLVLAGFVNRQVSFRVDHIALTLGIESKFPRSKKGATDGCHNYETWQRRLLGGVLWQDWLASIPRASGPQAAVCASRIASFSDAAEAVEQLVLPSNRAHTSQVTF